MKIKFKDWNKKKGSNYTQKHADIQAEAVRKKFGRKNLTYEEVCEKQGVKLSEQLKHHRYYRSKNG